MSDDRPTPADILAASERRGKGMRAQAEILPDVTEEEERSMREVFESFVQTQAGRYIHPVDPDEGTPLCDGYGRPADNWIDHPIETMPVGWRPVCRRCGKIWRDRW